MLLCLVQLGKPECGRLAIKGRFLLLAIQNSTQYSKANIIKQKEINLILHGFQLMVMRINTGDGLVIPNFYRIFRRFLWTYMTFVKECIKQQSFIHVKSKFQPCRN